MDKKSLKIIFMGTPDFSVPALDNLIASPCFDVIAVYTQPPRPAGRGQKLTLSPVHQLAERHSIPVYTPRSFKKEPEAVAQFVALGADVGVVAAYGLILPKDILDAPRFGCLNIHASLLPRWRGAAPIQRAIEAGDNETGITIMQMDVGLDTGAMISKKSIPIRAQTTGQSLHDSLSALGSSMIEDVLMDIYNGNEIVLEMQDDDQSCYASMLSKEEGRLDWSLSAIEIDRKVRAFTPWPGCWSLNQDGKRFKILEGEVSSLPYSSGDVGELLTADGHVRCEDGGVYCISRIQPENSKPMSVADAINGGKLSKGQRFS